MLEAIPVTKRLYSKQDDITQLGLPFEFLDQRIREMMGVRTSPYTYSIGITTKEGALLGAQLFMFPHVGDGDVTIPVVYQPGVIGQLDETRKQMVEKNRKALGLIPNMQEIQIYPKIGITAHMTTEDFSFIYGIDGSSSSLIIRRKLLTRENIKTPIPNRRKLEAWPLSEREVSALSAATLLSDFNRAFQHMLYGEPMSIESLLQSV
ncbi:MAG TPA: hypothetical protein VMR81_06200 [Patescibacteria group bacterium]|nr:hypothetical protein [Patescibacteria group bacterium]